MSRVMRCILTAGTCPFVSCSRTGLHEHELCETCGAVRHGNLGCPDCRRFHGFTLAPEVERVMLERTAN